MMLVLGNALPQAAVDKAFDAMAKEPLMQCGSKHWTKDHVQLRNAFVLKARRVYGNATGAWETGACSCHGCFEPVSKLPCQFADLSLLWRYCLKLCQTHTCPSVSFSSFPQFSFVGLCPFRAGRIGCGCAKACASLYVQSQMDVNVPAQTEPCGGLN